MAARPLLKSLSEGGSGRCVPRRAPGSNWLSLRDQIASIDTRLIELHARLTGGSRGLHWDEARDLAQEVHTVMQAEGDGARLVFQRLLDVLEAGADEESTWRRIETAMETRRRLTDSEGRMLDRLDHTFTVEQALAFIQVAAQLSREFVPTDRHAEFAHRLRLITIGAAEQPRPRPPVKPGAEPTD